VSAPQNPRAVAASSYLEEDIRTADPLRLVVHTLQLAVKHAAGARAALASGDLARKGQAVGRVCGCIGVLQAALDIERGGRVAADLDRLYTYLQHRLSEGHRQNDLAALEEVSRHIEEMAGAWREAAARQAGAVSAEEALAR
jgi:flagellar protein FliS